jgi:hypothetical protein
MQRLWGPVVSFGRHFREKFIPLVIAVAVLSFFYPGTASLAQDIVAPAEHTRVLADHLKGLFDG